MKWNPSLAGGLALLTTTLLLVSGEPARGNGTEERGPHGALPMNVQVTIFDKLLADRDVTQPPPEVDPIFWQEVIIPQDNAMTPERVTLGKKLFFDTRLSRDGTVACATCHDVSRGFTDQRRVSEGVGGALGQRNAPTTMNAMFMQTQFLDGRVPSLEEQAKLPIVNPIEMAHPNQQKALAAIAGDPEYQNLFQAAYGAAPNYEDLARAIAAFERTQVFLSAPFDRFLAGEEKAISEEAKRGWALFNGKARCVSCHHMNPSNPIGTDNRFHNIGVAARYQDFEQLARRALEALEKEGGIETVDQLALETDLSELGRFLVTKDRGDIGAFKTLQLRNIALTAPYMHDGSMQTLWDVMDHYNKGGEPNPFLDGGIEPLALSEEEIDALVAWMFTLTDERFADQNQAIFAEQRQQAKKARPFRDKDMAARRVLPFERRVKGED
ncbi:Cytochrome-c peroxidase [Nitrosococcus halophilus Nc 4]|uniref:Cytochrome-c peroxidase n=1 Tax=Nitrosococcus halophilus (strain Nc4) TaxID=472759 RepID=D5C340_NITHN|nr:cytochrome c peroxidase [Nitrosococcus halophilus]ADE14932.1 Cytochrome-c peroxidase [Nitrosococcus halophilus Nc 4]